MTMTKKEWPREFHKVAQEAAEKLHEFTDRYLQPGRPEREDPEMFLADAARAILTVYWDELDSKDEAKPGEPTTTQVKWIFADVIVAAVVIIAKDHGFDAERAAELARVHCKPGALM